MMVLYSYLRRTLLMSLPARFDGEAMRKHGLKIASAAVPSSADIAATSPQHEYRAHGCVGVVLETRYLRRCQGLGAQRWHGPKRLL